MFNLQKKTVLGIIVLYNPELYYVQNSVVKYLECLDHVFVWDNSEVCHKEIFETMENLSYFSDKKNIGLSRAYQKGVEFAQQKGFELIMTIDQDSQWENLSSFITHSKEYLNFNKCILGPWPYAKRKLSCSSRLQEADWVINSGLITTVDLIESIGGYSSFFFIDGIDIEICLRAKKMGFKVFFDTQSQIIQKYGDLIAVDFFYKKVSYNAYSSSRYKDIIFTHLYLYRLYKNKHLLKDLIGYFKLGIKMMLLDGNARWGLIKAMIKGVILGMTIRIKELS